MSKVEPPSTAKVGRRLTSLAAFTPLGHWEWNPLTNAAKYDERWAELLGYQEAELAPALDTWHSRIHPDDLAQQHADLQAHLAGHTPFYENIHRLRHRSGHFLYVVSRGQVVERDEDGRPLLCRGTHADITLQCEREERLYAQIAESEQRFRTTFECSGSGMLIISLDLRIQQVNGAFASFLGYPKDALCGKSRCDLDLFEDGETAMRELALLRQGSGHVLHSEQSYRHMSGRTVYGSVSRAIVRAEDGTALHFLEQVQDITSRRQAESEKQRLVAQLTQAHKMDALGTLAGGMAHEFNNLLAGILANAEFLQSTPSEQENPSVATREIISAARRGAQLVRQILTFSQQGERRLVPIDLAAVIRPLLSMLRSLLPAAIEISHELSDETLLTLADEAQMQQVLTNLCTNAWHAMEKHGGRLTVALSYGPVSSLLRPSSPLLDDGMYACIRVSDTGEGMDADTQKRIFDPFYTTKPTSKGVGLGLAVVHGIVHAHGGIVRVQSHLGRGTSFEIYLPTARDEASLASAPARRQVVSPAQRILVVDDESIIVLSFTRLLTQLGYQVHGTSDPHEAITLWRSQTFDLAILDISMPALSGWQLAEKLHTLRSAIPILLMTGYSAEIANTDMARCGVREVLEKPISKSELAEHVRAALRSTQASNPAPSFDRALSQ